MRPFLLFSWRVKAAQIENEAEVARVGAEVLMDEAPAPGQNLPILRIICRVGQAARSQDAVDAA